MTVLTLHMQDFDNLCRRLSDRVQEWKPDLIVGILTGGAEVGRRVAARLPDARYVELRLQRKGTPKKRIIRNLLRRLPMGVADRLRILEARWAARKPVSLRPVALGEEVADVISQVGKGRILVTDDAVDSGGTLLSVVETLKGIVPEAEMMTAVFSVTTPNPAIRPDIALWNDGTLIRFPWSLDYRKGRK